TCTAWQLKSAGDLRIINDHSDPEYDAEVRARLAAIHETALPICADLAATMDRFASYGPRLQLALDRVMDGHDDWFTRPVIDSYHTVWFELHEDLLSTLGIERSKEAAR
ncbi:MAG: MarR family transcriptional regulator, partial [Acidimicrobiales bacterium]